MHPDLAKLLDLQGKDEVVDDVDRRLGEVATDRAALDAALAVVDREVEAARRVVRAAEQRRDDLEAKVNAYRQQESQRRKRIEFERNPKHSAALMAELDATVAAIAAEEGEWMKAAEGVGSVEKTAAEVQRKRDEAAAKQAPDRAAVEERAAVLGEERARAMADREASAVQLDATLRKRYEGLRRTRRTRVIVALQGTNCGACFTAVPRSRIGQFQRGAGFEPCEACGVILYSAKVAKA